MKKLLKLVKTVSAKISELVVVMVVILEKRYLSLDLKINNLKFSFFGRK